MKTITNNLYENYPLYCKYPGQYEPQPAYIELDCREEGRLIAYWDAGNGVPPYYWNDFAVRWDIRQAIEGSWSSELP